MPELPEVETIARGLQKRVAGDLIESVWIGDKTNFLKSPAAEIARTLTGARIASVKRVGKHLVLDLSGSAKPRAGKGASGKSKGSPEGKSSPAQARIAPSKATATLAGVPAPDSQLRREAQWIVHLGMTGRMLICDPAEPLAKHTHLVAQLASGRELRFVDPRRFGKVQVIEGARFKAAGREPIGADRGEFAALFRERKAPIKSALLNQKLLSGIGNIYADESLFRARVRPRRRAASLTRDELKRLYDALQRVLAEAIAAGGSSVSDYVDASGEAGFFQLHHRVYGREGKPCLVCKTPIKRIVIGGRSSHYCHKCQK
jgi:formamidopyrimidine-DNA glycosylase